MCIICCFIHNYQKMFLSSCTWILHRTDVNEDSFTMFCCWGSFRYLWYICLSDFASCMIFTWVQFASCLYPHVLCSGINEMSSCMTKNFWCEAISRGTKLDNIMMRNKGGEPPYFKFFNEHTRYNWRT